MTNTNESKKRPEFKIGDVIEVSMNIENQIPSEDEEKLVIDLTDYDTKYEIHYSYPRGLGFSTTYFTLDAGYSSDFGNDIKQYIKEYLKADLAEITEYELFDIDNTCEYQTAKIRVKALK